MQLWTPGQQLRNSKFTIQKVLGVGSYGVTYSAIDQNTNNIVAIKTLGPWCQIRSDFEQRQVKFVEEAFRLVQCSHFHIVKVHKVINESGLRGMVMEYIQGQNLEEYIKKRGKLAEAEALKYINQVGRALEYIHSKGLLHRDVKPNNIMLRQNQQEAVLIDFGLAREFHLNQKGSMTCSGTDGYAPIEQYETQGIFGAYTDIYALAATLYTLLTGEVPLTAFLHGHKYFPPPKELNPKISDVLNDWMLKGMSFKPQDRPQTVREYLELVMPTPVKLTIPTQPLPNPNKLNGKQLQKFKFEYAKINEKLQIIKYPGETEGFTEDLGNGVILEMVQITGGSFIMGAPEDEKRSKDNERPQHKVNIQPFFIGKYQVTQEQYQVIIGTNPSYFKSKKRPVERVTWNSALVFCNKLSQLTKKKYQLPTEAEWEYACRGGTNTPFHFGKIITTDLANYNGNYKYDNIPQGKDRKYTIDVGSFPANPFGLYDMHGNVWEWCFDDWHDSYEGASADGSPCFKNNSNNRSIKIFRGGSWLNSLRHCRSANRDNNALRSRRDNTIGFRVVCRYGIAS